MKNQRYPTNVIYGSEMEMRSVGMYRKVDQFCDSTVIMVRWKIGVAPSLFDYALLEKVSCIKKYALKVCSSCASLLSSKQKGDTYCKILNLMHLWLLSHSSYSPQEVFTRPSSAAMIGSINSFRLVWSHAAASLSEKIIGIINELLQEEESRFRGARIK